MGDDRATFLGRGWSFPPAFTSGGADVAMADGPEDVHQSLWILAATTPGERVMRPDFGCDLFEMQFEEVDLGFANRVAHTVSDAVLRHEPRVDLNGVDVNPSASEQGVVVISVDYTLRSSNSRYNMVFPFYVHEARTPGV